MPIQRTVTWIWLMIICKYRWRQIWINRFCIQSYLILVITHVYSHTFKCGNSKRCSVDEPAPFVIGGLLVPPDHPPQPHNPHHLSTPHPHPNPPPPPPTTAPPTTHRPPNHPPPPPTATPHRTEQRNMFSTTPLIIHSHEKQYFSSNPSFSVDLAPICPVGISQYW